MREKLIRLQSLYIDQFKRLQHLLKERKRRYLHSSKAEHDAAHTTRSSQRCLAFVDDVRCSNPSLPMTRHCLA
ncbi:UNVERIFIED_CONTAM: hypothetical protein H355_014961, partial [Colinus virginianus]